MTLRNKNVWRAVFFILLIARTLPADDKYFKPLLPPYRGHNHQVTTDEDGIVDEEKLLDFFCPPTKIVNGMKVRVDPGGPPDPKSPHDATRAGDPSKVDMHVVDHPGEDRDNPRKDYFLGSWTFLDASGHDIKVTKWCINDRGETNPPFSDYITFQIQRSYTVTTTGDGSGSQDVEENLVPPGTPT
jgi:hypothetical protein